MLWTKKYWMDTIERIVSTVAEVILAAFGTDKVAGASFQIAARYYLGLAVGAAIVTLVKCLAATRVGAENTAALLPAGPDTDKGQAYVSVVVVAVVATIVTIAILKVFHLI